MLSIGFFRALAKFKGPRLRVQVNDKIWDEPLVVALAADTPKAGGGIMHLAPGANMTDGQMDISLIHAIGRFNVARHFIRLVRGTYLHHPQVQYFPATALEIEAGPAQTVIADGDLIGRTPVRIERKTRALTFIRSSS